MENNTNNIENKLENKKKNSLIIIIAIIILAVIVMVILKNNNKKIQPESLSQTDIEFNQALADDSTKSINDNLNSITLTDTTNVDLFSADQELKKL